LIEANDGSLNLQKLNYTPYGFAPSRISPCGMIFNAGEEVSAWLRVFATSWLKLFNGFNSNSSFEFSGFSRLEFLIPVVEETHGLPSVGFPGGIYSLNIFCVSFPSKS
jgi:hypothetical protein